MSAKPLVSGSVEDFANGQWGLAGGAELVAPELSKLWTCTGDLAITPQNTILAADPLGPNALLMFPNLSKLVNGIPWVLLAGQSAKIVLSFNVTKCDALALAVGSMLTSGSGTASVVQAAGSVSSSVSAPPDVAQPFAYGLKASIPTGPTAVTCTIELVGPCSLLMCSFHFSPATTWMDKMKAAI
jgi:hypothetical protein